MLASPYLIGTINGPISNVKTKLLQNGSIALAFTAPTTDSGQLLNPETLPKPASTAREYESIRTRFWNTYWKPHRSTLWYTTMMKDETTTNYTLSKGPCHNALQDTAIEFPWSEGSMSGDSYEIASTGLLVNVVNPKYNPAERLTGEVFYVALKTFNETTTTVLPLTHVLKGWTGSATGGTFSPNGKKIALLKHKDWRRDWAHPSIFILDLEKRHPKTTVPTFELRQYSTLPDIIGTVPQLHSSGQKTILSFMPLQKIVGEIVYFAFISTMTRRSFIRARSLFQS